MTEVESKLGTTPFADNGAALAIGVESPASSSKRLLDLVAEPENVLQRRQVHVVFVYHPDVDVVHSALPSDIAQCIGNLYKAHDANVYVAQARYGWNQLDAPELSEDSLATPSEEDNLQVSGFTDVGDFLKKRRSATRPDVVLSHANDDIACRRVPERWREEMRKRFAGSVDEASSTEAKQQTETAGRRRVVDGLVAAVELFTAHSVLIAPIGRYIVHIVPSLPNLDLSETSFPLHNTDSSYDSATWRKAASELGEIGAYPMTIAIEQRQDSETYGAAAADVKPEDDITSLSEQAMTVHNGILKRLPSVLSTAADNAGTLGTQYASARYAKAMLLSGLSATAAQASKDTIGGASLYFGRKRARTDEVRESATGPVGEGQVSKDAVPSKTDTQGNPLASVPFAQGMDTEKNKQIVQKAAFIQQLQQIMIRNLKAIKERQMRDAPNDLTRNQMIEKVKEQLMQHYEALRRELQAMHNAGKTPDLGSLLHALITIDEEAGEKGMKLGGPCNIPALMTKHRQRQQDAGQAAESTADKIGVQGGSALPAATSAPQAASQATSEASANAANVGSAATGQKRPGQAVWVGAISWTIALPNSKRSQAATIVAAQCAPNTNRESLMLPWPTKMQVSEVQMVSLSALQQYASTNGIPCILFQPHAPSSQGQDGQQRPAGVPTQQQNESMYMMLARMIDSKKGCAFLKLQGPNATPEAGIVVIPTAPPGGGPNRRLLGLLFDKAVPWHLFAPQQSKEAAALAVAASSTAPAKEDSVAAPAPPQATIEPPAASSSADTAMSTAQLNQQLPSWARPQGAAAASTAPLQPVQQPVMPAAGIPTSMGTPTQPLAQSAQLQNLLAGVVGQGADASGGNGAAAGSAGALPSNIDFEALQKMLNLLPS